jgi:hypothetical protein
MLQVKGIQAKVEIVFPDIPLDGVETEERMLWYRTRRVLMERDAGIIDHNHAANLLYDLPEAEGIESPVESKSVEMPTRSGGRSGGRALIDKYKGGWYGLKDARLKTLEKAFRLDLEHEYDRMGEKIINELGEEAKLMEGEV